MRGVGQEPKDAGQLFAKNPALVFFAVLVVGLAVSSMVAGVCKGDCPLGRNSGVTRAVLGGGPSPRASVVRRGAKFHGVILQMVAWPGSQNKSSPADRSATAQNNSTSRNSANPGAPKSATEKPPR